MYHSIGLPEIDDTMQLRVSPLKFQSHIEALVQGGWKIKTVGDLLQSVEKGQEVAISFDDGYRGQIEASEILEGVGARGTFFVIPGLVGKNMPGKGCWSRWSLMSPDEIKELCRRGHEIGSHSLTHPGPLDREKPNTQRQEVYACRERLENMIGRPVQGFSYPHGGFSAAVKQAVAKAGYRYACCSRPGQIIEKHDLFELPRIEIRGSDSLEKIQKKIAGYGETLRWLRYFLGRKLGKIKYNLEKG